MSLSLVAARADTDFICSLYSEAIATSLAESEMANIDDTGSHMVILFQSSGVDYEGCVQVVAIIQYVGLLGRGLAYFLAPKWMFTGMETTALDTITERVQEMTWTTNAPAASAAV